MSARNFIAHRTISYVCMKTWDGYGTNNLECCETKGRSALRGNRVLNSFQLLCFVPTGLNILLFSDKPV